MRPRGAVLRSTGRSGLHRRGEVRRILHGPRLRSAPGELRRQPAGGGTVTEAEEAAFAFSHPGQVDDVGATSVSAEPNERLLWNFLVERADLRPPTSHG